MTTMTATAADTILDWVFNGTAASSGSRYLGLATNSSLTECTGGSYARQNLASAMAAAAASSVSSDTAISFSIGTDVATYWFVHDASSGAGTLGKFLYGALPAAKTGSFTLSIGDIVATFTAT